MIPEAQPKQGLETGSLEGASGLSTRDQVARNYEEDLSGKNGPTARFDTLRELINTEISAALNEMRFSSGDGTQIFGRDGKFAVNQPTAKRPAKAAQGESVADEPKIPWSLVIEDFESGEVSLRLGKILDQSDTHTGNLPCSNPTGTYTPSANGFLLIKFVDQEPTDYQIVYESSWPVTGGYFVETELDGDDNPVFKTRYYPLYKFLGSATSETVAISSSVHALRLAPPTHLHLIDTYFRASTGEHIPCPHLIAGHRNTTA